MTQRPHDEPRTQGTPHPQRTWTDILSAVLAQNDGMGRALILCRTRPQADDIRRAVAQTGGFLGLDINTLPGLALSLFPAAPLSDVPIIEAPLDDPLLCRIGPEADRPGLYAHLRSLLMALRLDARVRSTAIESDGGVLNQVQQLARTGFGVTDLERALTAMIDCDDLRQRVDATVFAVGFPPPPAFWEEDFVRRWSDDDALWARVSPVERHLLTALGAIPLYPDVPTGSPEVIPAVRVPDVCAEARLAAAILQREVTDGRTAFVLVPDEPTAQRLSTTAAQLGVSVAGGSSMRYSAHGLAEILRELSPLFEPVDGTPPADPMVRASVLLRILTHPLMGNRFPAPVRNRLRLDIEGIYRYHQLDVPDERVALHLSVRRLNDALREVRVLEAPLSRWRRRFAERCVPPATPPGEADRRRVAEGQRCARLLLERLERLHRCLTGTPFDAGDDPTDDSDPTADIALLSDEPDLLGPELGTPISGLPPAGSFGAMHRFVTDCRLRVRGDRCARDLLSELADLGATPVTPGRLTALLHGRSRPDELRDGVTVLSYDDYDDRTVDTLLLLGVHNRGIALSGTPDPFLRDRDLARIGYPPPRGAALFRMRQAMRAVAISATANEPAVLAIVSERDSTGRNVVAPIQLPLQFDGTAIHRWMAPEVDMAVDTFGSRLARTLRPSLLACDCDVATLDGGADSYADPSPPGSALRPRNRHLAVQANAEWYRRGMGRMAISEAWRQTLRGEDEEKNPLPDVSALTLGERITRMERLCPDFVAPWLGETGPLPDHWRRTPDGALRQWSHSRHFDPLCNCLYRLFALQVLNVQEMDPVSDELDPREVGQVVHRAFELADQDDHSIPWRVDTRGLSKDAAKERIAAATGEARRRLGDLIRSGFKGEIALMDGSLDAVAAATTGLCGRWENRLDGYVRERIKDTGTLDTQRKDILEQLRAKLFDGPDMEVLIVELRGRLGLLNPPLTKLERDKKVPEWLQVTLDGVDRNGMAELLRDDIEREILCIKPPGEQICILPLDAFSILKEFVHDPLFGERADRIVAELKQIQRDVEVFAGRQMATVSELSFGVFNAPDEPLLLPFGREVLPVKGQIDRVLVLSCGDDDIRLQLLDYKTGRFDKEYNAGVANLSRPQLPLYALALTERLSSRSMPPPRIPPGATVGQLAVDFVREEKGLTDDFLVTPTILESWRTQFGTLLDLVSAGRFWPLPMNSRAFGYSRGRIPLSSAVRFVQPIRPPDWTEMMGAMGDTEPSDGEVTP